MVKDQKVEGVFKAIDKQTKASEKRFSRLNKSIKSFRTSLNRLPVNAVKGLASGLGNALSVATQLGSALAVASFGFGIVRAVEEAKQLEDALTGLRSIAINSGNDFNKIEEAAKSLASDGLIPLTNVAASLKNLLSAGLDADQAIEIFQVFRDSAAFARQGSLSLGEAVEGATQGLKNQLSTLLDNAGITKNISVLYKEYAATIDTTVGRLTEAQKVQALYTGLIREGQIFQGDYNKLLLTFSGAVSRVSGSFRFLLAEVGELITKNPFVVAGLNLLAKQFQNLIGNIRSNRDEYRDLVSDGIEFVADSFAGLLKTIDLVNRGLKASLDSFKIFGRAILVGVLKPIQLVSDAFAGLKNAIQDTFVGNTIGRAIDGVKDLGSSIADFGTGVLKRFGFGDLAENVSMKSKEITQSINGIAKDIDLDESIDDLISNIGDDYDDLIKRFEEKSLLGDASVQAENFTDDLRKTFKRIERDPPKVPVDLQEPPKREVQSFLDSIFAGADKQLRAGITSAISGLGSALAQGKAGGRALASGFVKSFAKAIPQIGPILGDAIGGIADFLLSDPAEARQKLNEFFSNLPNLIENLAENLPFFFEKFITGMNDAIVRVSERADIIAENIVEGFIRALPRIATSLATIYPRLAVGIGEAFVRGIRRGVENVGNIFKSLFRFDGGGRGAVEKFLGFDFPFLKFASGGLIGGQSLFPGDSLMNDRVPALLSPGEAVVPKSAIEGGPQGIADFFKSIGVPGFGFGSFFKRIGGVFKSAAQVLQERISAATNVFGGVRDLDFKRTINEFTRLPTNVIERAAREKLADLGDQTPLGTSLDSIVDTLGIDDLLGFASFLLPKNLREILESLSRVGFQVKATDILRDPTNVIQNTIKNQKDILAPFFRQMIRRFPGMQEGGTIGGNFLNDTFPARLSSGETVIDRGLTNRLDRFLDSPQQSNEDLMPILQDIRDQLAEPVQATASVQLNQREFAEIFIELTRTNTRLVI